MFFSCPTRYFSSETFGFAIGLEEAFQLFWGNRYDSAMARMEIHTDSMVNHFEMFQIGTFGKLVFTFRIYIIHQNILIGTNQRENTRTFYRILRLLFIVIRFCPLAGG